MFPKFRLFKTFDAIQYPKKNCLYFSHSSFRWFSNIFSYKGKLFPIRTEYGMETPSNPLEEGFTAPSGWESYFAYKFRAFSVFGLRGSPRSRRLRENAFSKIVQLEYEKFKRDPKDWVYPEGFSPNVLLIDSLTVKQPITLEEKSRNLQILINAEFGDKVTSESRTANALSIKEFATMCVQSQVDNAMCLFETRFTENFISPEYFSSLTLKEQQLLENQVFHILNPNVCSLDEGIAFLDRDFKAERLAFCELLSSALAEQPSKVHPFYRKKLLLNCIVDSIFFFVPDIKKLFGRFILNEESLRVRLTNLCKTLSGDCLFVILAQSVFRIVSLKSNAFDESLQESVANVLRVRRWHLVEAIRLEVVQYVLRVVVNAFRVENVFKEKIFKKRFDSLMDRLLNKVEVVLKDDFSGSSRQVIGAIQARNFAYILVDLLKHSGFLGSEIYYPVRKVYKKSAHMQKVIVFHLPIRAQKYLLFAAELFPQFTRPKQFSVSTDTYLPKVMAIRHGVSEAILSKEAKSALNISSGKGLRVNRDFLTYLCNSLSGLYPDFPDPAPLGRQYYPIDFVRFEELETDLLEIFNLRKPLEGPLAPRTLSELQAFDKYYQWHVKEFMRDFDLSIMNTIFTISEAQFDEMVFEYDPNLRGDFQTAMIAIRDKLNREKKATPRYSISIDHCFDYVFAWIVAQAEKAYRREFGGKVFDLRREQEIDRLFSNFEKNCEAVVEQVKKCRLLWLFQGYQLFFFDRLDYRLRMYPHAQMFSRTSGVWKHALEDYSSEGLSESGLHYVLIQRACGTDNQFGTYLQSLEHSLAACKGSYSEWYTGRVKMDSRRTFFGFMRHLYIYSKKISGGELTTDVLKEMSDPLYFLLLDKAIQRYSLIDQIFHFRVEIDQAASSSMFLSLLFGDLALGKACALVDDEASTLPLYVGLIKPIQEFFISNNKVPSTRGVRTSWAFFSGRFFPNKVKKPMSDWQLKPVIKSLVMMFSYGQGSGSRLTKLLEFYEKDTGLAPSAQVFRSLKWFSDHFESFLGSLFKDAVSQRRRLIGLQKLLAKVERGNTYIKTLDGCVISYKAYNKVKQFFRARFFSHVSRKSVRYRYMASKTRPDIKRLSRIFLANFIQSIDGAVVRKVLLVFFKKTSYVFTATHDAFHVHPNYVKDLYDAIDVVYKKDSSFKSLVDSLFLSQYRCLKEDIKRVNEKQLFKISRLEGNLSRIKKSELFKPKMFPKQFDSRYTYLFKS